MQEIRNDAFSDDLRTIYGKNIQMMTPFTDKRTEEKLIRISDHHYSKVDPWHESLQTYRNHGGPPVSIGEQKEITSRNKAEKSL